MAYSLESEKEFERLERQSTYPKYDYKKELEGFVVQAGSHILDAGCGSGVISRYLGETIPNSKVVGIDMSSDRIAKASEHSSKPANVTFVAGSLASLPFEDQKFDAIVCRYVIEHLPPEIRTIAFSEMTRVLKPGGIAWIVDFDGIYINLFPQTSLVAEVLSKIQAGGSVDFHVGRKIPKLMAQAGFQNVSWRIETISVQGQYLADEKILLPERLEHALPLIKSVAGSETRAKDFCKEFINVLDQPGTVLFYNKFIVHGTKPHDINDDRPRLRLVTSND